MKVALASLDQLWGDKKGNFDACIEIVRKAANHGVDVLIFPEMTLTGFYLDPALLGESKSNSETLRKFGGLCSEYKLTIIFGACLIDDIDQKSRNYLCVAEQNGISNAIYAKIHTFSHAGEDRVMSSGLSPSSFDVEGNKFGASICYDLRFPIFSRNLGSPPYDVALYSACWAAPRIAAWDILLAARAIENQCYVVGVNRCGEEPGPLLYPGHSRALSPLGEVLASAPDHQPEALRCVLSASSLTDLRVRLPFLQDGDKQLN
jgi:predicted amidohydrolase